MDKKKWLNNLKRASEEVNSWPEWKKNSIGLLQRVKRFKMSKDQRRVEELENAIRKHRDQTGHNMCWENDEELWTVLNDHVKIDHTPPSWSEFITKCAQYRASRDRRN